MKKIILLVLVTVIYYAGYAQCGTIMVNATNQLYPDTATNLPQAIIGKPYNSVLQVFAPATVINGGIPFTVNYINIDNITGLPQGFNYSTSPVSGSINGGSSGCILFNSSLNMLAPGQFPITINYSAMIQGVGLLQGTIEGYRITSVSGPKAVSGSLSNPPNYTLTKVGTTLNNQQTNASIYRRVQLFSGNNVGVTWTTSSDASPFTNRGTGYNRFNGTSWVNPATTSARIETQRAGFPSYAYNPTTNEEIILSHIVSSTGFSGGMVLSRRTAGTNNVWTQTTVLDTIQSVPGVLWCRTAISNNFMHVITAYADSSGTQPVTVIKSGVISPVVYSRYSFATSQWQVVNTPLPGYHSSRAYRGGSDEYAIDASGSTVAVLTGGLAKDISLWKSTNNGTSWAKIMVDSFKYSPMNYNVLMPDTPRTNDGTVNVLVDNAGKVHCFWAASRVFDDDVSDNSITYFPGGMELKYWNDQKSYGSIDVVAEVTDTDNDGDVQLGVNWNDPTVRYGNSSLITMPSTGISSDGKIYCLYSAITEYDESFSGANYRDAYIVHSSNGGNTWSAPVNITGFLGGNIEQAFPSIARTVNNRVHLSYVHSTSPGPTAAGAWDIYYMSVDTGAIANDMVGNSLVSTYHVSDTVFCKGGSPIFNLSDCSLWKGAVNLGSGLIIETPATTTLYTIKSPTGTTIRNVTITINDSLNLQKTPTADPILICGNASFQLSVSSAYSGSKTYQWYKDNIQIDQLSVTQRTLTDTGVYRVEASTTTGCKSDIVFNVKGATVLFNPNFTVNRQTATQQPFNFDFTNTTPSASSYNFTWYWGDGNSKQDNNTSQSHTYTFNGQFDVKLVAVDKVTGCRDSVVKVGFITCSGGAGGFALSTSKTSPVCSGESTGSFTITVLGGKSPFTYKLNNGSFQSSNVFTGLAAGIYNIEVKDADNVSVTKTDTLTDPPALVVGIITGNNGVPANSTQTYSITSQLNTTYSWSVTNGTIQSGNGTNSISVQWGSSAGTGKVKVVITKNTCTAADSMAIGIGATPLTLTASHVMETCPGKQDGSITLSAGGGSSPYQYAINNGSFQTLNSFAGLKAGIYLMKVRDANSIITQLYDTITAGTGTAVGAISGPVNATAQTNATYSSTQVTGASYAWTVTGGTINSGQGSNTIQVTWGVAGTGNVKVKLTDAAGCVDSNMTTVSIGSVGINEVNQMSYQVFPNPASQHITVRNNHATLEGAQVKITDLLGRVVVHTVVNENTGSAEISVAELSAGTYVLEIKQEDKLSRIKLIKQ